MTSLWCLLFTLSFVYSAKIYAPSGEILKQRQTLLNKDANTTSNKSAHGDVKGDSIAIGFRGRNIKEFHHAEPTTQVNSSSNIHLSNTSYVKALSFQASAIISHHGNGGARKAERDPDSKYDKEITKEGNELPMCAGSFHRTGLCTEKMGEFSNTLTKEDMANVQAAKDNPGDPCLPLPETTLTEVECAIVDTEAAGPSEDFTNSDCHAFFCSLGEGDDESETFYSSVWCPERKCSKGGDADGAPADAGTDRDGEKTKTKESSSEANSFQLLPVPFISALILWMGL